MADIVLTPQQQLAATDRRGPLLVSAAAGSGKTRVLVERLFDAMVRQGRNVDDFLIITYTRAAASELRGKIAAELSRRLAAGPEDPHLRRQMFRVYQADIKTVDAFCAALLRQSVHLLPPVEGRSLTPDFRVLDEPEAELLRVRVLQRVLDRFYEKLEAGDAAAALLAETLGAGRDDRALEALVLRLHQQIQSHPYPLRWLRQSGESWRSLPDDLAASPYGREILKGTVRRAAFWADRLERELRDLESWPTILEKYGPAMSGAAASLRRWAAEADRGWDAMGAAVPAFEKLGTVRDKEVTERKDRAKDLYARCRKEVAGPLSAPYRVTSAEHLADLRTMAPAVEALIALTEDFTAAYQAEKVRRNCMDFSDQEHDAIAVLLDENGQPTELAAQVAARYQEVMVDEYQDSNAVQDLIFRAVSDGGRRLFAVGDVKQSIYRFRLADPTIFLAKYDAWPAPEEAEDGQPRKVLLQENFRSRAQVLQAANFIFGGVMSRGLGELDYGADEQLRCGADYYLPRTDADVELHLLSPQGDEEESVDRTAAEAAFVARTVRRMLDQGFPVQEGESFRPVRPEDIVILMRSPSARQSAYAAAMARERVPFDADESDDFFASVEIAVVFSFLQIVDNPRQDVPLISVLRSPLLGFTPDRLAAIRAARPSGDFYDAVAADGGEDTADFLALLDRLRAAARELPVDRLLWQLYTETRAMAVFGAMEGGEQRKNHLIAFFTYAGQMAAAGRSGLFDFVTYLRRLLEQGRAPNPSTRQGSGGVRLMSIHRSKGLEFPVVILADLQRAFHLRSLSEPVLVHPALGLGPDCVDRDRSIRYDTAAKTAVATALERESKSEEMRILYVSMTRAKEKLILVDCMKNARTRVRRLADMASYPADPEAVAQCGCLGDWVLLALLAARQGEPLRRWAERETGEELPDAPGWTVRVWDGDDVQAALPAERAGETRPELPFDPAELERQYAHGAAAVIPGKVTATQLKGREKDQEIAEGAPASYRPAAFRRPRFLQGERRLTGAERGTAMHLAMQFVELGDADEAAVASRVASLRERHLMTPEQAEAVDCAAIAAFLRSPLGRRAAAAERCYREYRFALLMDASLYDPAGAGEELMLQGVVDCAFDTPEGLVILDFKTDRIAPGGEGERAAVYRPQLEAYAAALSRVLERPVAEKWLWFFTTGQAYLL